MAKINNGILVKLGTWAIVIIFSAGAVYAVVHYRLDAVERRRGYLSTVMTRGVKLGIAKTDKTRALGA